MNALFPEAGEAVSEAAPTVQAMFTMSGPLVTAAAVNWCIKRTDKKEDEERVKLIAAAIERNSAIVRSPTSSAEEVAEAEKSMRYWRRQHEANDRVRLEAMGSYDLDDADE